MKIRALRTLRGDSGTIRRDAEADLPEAKAKALIARGLAVAADDAPAPKPERVKPHLASSEGRPKTKTKTTPKTKGAKAPEGE